jgi:hypothetical protein
VAGCCECGDEHSGSCATELVSTSNKRLSRRISCSQNFLCSSVLYQPFRRSIVTYVRFPWLNNVSTAVTMDSTTLLHFLSYATILDGLSAIGG